ncbi:MAG: type II CRISPR-associated endonuclease Cas1 [Alphaproteobacteria bacterium]
MLNNIIEINDDGKTLTTYRGFLRIKEEGEIVKDLPFDSLGGIIVSANQVIYTHSLLQRLIEENIPLVICGKNYNPSGLLLGINGNYQQTRIQQMQISISKPLQKNLWQKIVQEKIKNQSKVLKFLKNDTKLDYIATQVLSGDTTNQEAVAARYYFSALFGDNFVRDTNKSGINSFLNYGYAIIRGVIARFVVATGLNPSFGVNHHSYLNPFCLVDDLIEPFRPVVDLLVYKIFNGIDDVEKSLEAESKKFLIINILHKDIKTLDGISELPIVTQNYVRSFANSCLNKTFSLSITDKLIDSYLGDYYE